MVKALPIVAVVVVVVIVIAGAVYYVTRPPAVEFPSTINLAYDFAICEAPFFIAISEGYFADEGLTATFEIFPCETAAELREVVHTGHATLAYAAYEFLPAVDHLADFVYVSGAHTGCHELVVSSRLWDQGIRDEDAWADWVREGALAGTKRKHAVTAFGNSPYYFTAFVLAEHGLTMSDIEVVIYDWAAIPISMGVEFDSYTGWDPMPRILEGEDLGHIIVDPALVEPYASYFCCFMGMNRTFTETWPDETVKILAALHRAQQLIIDDPHYAAELMVAFGPDLVPYTVEEVEESISIYNYEIMGDPAVEQTTILAYAQILYDLGLLGHEPDWILEHGYQHLYP